MPASRIVSSWLVYSNQTADDVVMSYTLRYLPLDVAHVEIIFQHEQPPSEWIPVCG